MAYSLELTSRAEATHFWFQGFRAYVAPVIRDIASGRRDLRLLDCGCGTGYNLMTLLRPYGETFAFDLTEEAVQRARRAQRPLVRADLQHIPFSSGAFDLTTSFDVMQSVPDDVRALREMARVLRPGGHAVLNVTALNLLHGDHSHVWDEQRRYTAATAASLVGNAGLTVVRISYLFASLTPMILTVRTAQRMLRRWRTPSGDADLTVPPAPINALLAMLVKGEAALARRVPMPVGSSLLIVAKKT